MSRNQKLKYRGDDSICPICLTEVKKGKEKRLPCRHILHKKCFDRLQSKGHWRCPTCREPFTRRTKKCSYEAKVDNFRGFEVDQYMPSLERTARRSYWDNLSLLPPLTPPSSDNTRGYQLPKHRGSGLDSPRSCSREEKERTACSPSRRRSSKRESPVSRRRARRENPASGRRVQEEARRERRRGRQPYLEDNQDSRERSLSPSEDDEKEYDNELYNQVVENLTEEPFFRFFSSNIVHEHEEREGIRWSRSRRDSPGPKRRRDRRE